MRVSSITSEPGHAHADTPRGDQAKTRRSRYGTLTKKGSKSHFGYKLHILLDKDHQLIRRITTTTASLHDSRIDLSEKGETVYRDKGYFGVKPGRPWTRPCTGPFEIIRFPSRRSAETRRSAGRGPWWSGRLP